MNKRWLELAKCNPERAAELFDEVLPRIIAADADLARRVGGVYHVHVSGPDGGDWTIDLGSEAPSCTRGLHGRATRIAEIADRDLIRVMKEPSFPALSTYHHGVVGVSGVLSVKPPVVLDPDIVSTYFKAGLNGVFIKIDHLGNPPSLNGASSFIEFNDVLRAAGLTDRVLDIPITEHGTHINGVDLGGLEALFSGLFFTTDRLRFRINNVHARLEHDMEVSFEPDAIVLAIRFHSNEPTLKGEGRASLAMFFGAPLGWLDVACPDVNLTSLVVRARLVPYIDSTHTLAMRDIGIEVSLDADVDALESLIADGFDSAIAKELNTKELRDAIAKFLHAMITTKAGPRSMSSYIDICVDENGVAASFQG